MALGTAAGVSLAYILLPMFFVVWLAFFAQEIPSFPPEGYSLKWFRAVPGNDRFVNGFLLSLQVAVVSTSIGLAIGVPAAVCLVRGRFAGREAVNNLLLLPLIVPGIVLGIALYVFHVETEIVTGWPILGSLGGLVAGHVLIAIPWTVRLITASLVGMDRSVEEAAQSLGADRLTTFRRVTLPAILPGIVAAALFGFIASFGNLEMSLFLVGPGRTTLPIAILQYLRMEDRPDHRGGIGSADPVYRRGDAADRSLRQDRPRGLIMAHLQLTGVTKRYGEFKAADDISLDIADGEFLVLLGPSGCGKTTTLRIVAGFIEPTSGSVRLGDRDITGLPPWKRNTGVVFQSYALFPHMTVAENIAFGLEMRKVPKAEMAPKITEALRLVRLDHLSDRLPRQLSGGQQQRVALARALVFRPDVLLLDEPLSNLDAKLRQDVRVEIRELQRKLGLTTVMVTHDQEEALTMADRLVVMSEGRIRQIGSQQDLYERPAEKFVADFVGRSTFIDGRMDGPGRFVSAGGLVVACEGSGTGDASLALRPERLALTSAAAPAMDNSFPGAVEFISYLGSQVDLHVRLSPKERVIVQIQNRPEQPLPVIGEQVHVGWSKSTGRVFQS